jgi:hypothetical protein
MDHDPAASTAVHGSQHRTRWMVSQWDTTLSVCSTWPDEQLPVHLHGRMHYDCSTSTSAQPHTPHSAGSPQPLMPHLHPQPAAPSAPAC